jgi:TIR domain
MKTECQTSAECFALLLRECLASGEPVHIDDLGIFMPGPNKQGFLFIPNQMQRVFIAYVQEDAALARKLYTEFAQRGFNTWMDKKKLLPGQNWPRAIESAIENADFFVPCFSRHSVSKRGVFQSELRYALECASRMPLDQMYIIPVRLDDCIVPRMLQGHIQYVDLFPDWAAGVETVTAAMQQQMTDRGRRSN